MTHSDAFDEITAAINYPMFVVTTRHRAERSGCLVGFATQTSIDPPHFLVGISQANHTHGVAANAEHLAVHLIPRDHLELATLFGGTTGDTTDKFARCAWSDGPHDLPILDDAAMWFAGRILERIDMGDHTGLLIEPDAGEVRTDARGPEAWVSFADTKDIEPGHDA